MNQRVSKKNCWLSREWIFPYNWWRKRVNLGQRTVDKKTYVDRVEYCTLYVEPPIRLERRASSLKEGSD